MNLHIVGCGFLGSLLVEEACKRAYALHEQYTFHLYDPNTIEERNAANQLWTPSDAGQHKVQVLAQRIARYHGQSVQMFPEKIEQGNSAWLKDADVVVCAVDNIPTRQLLWKNAITTAVPLLNVGISQGGTGAVDWTYEEIDTNPFAVSQGASDKELERWGKVDRLPPCELVGFRGLGLNMAMAATKALFILQGWDVEGHVHRPGRKASWGTFTVWQAEQAGHSLLQSLVHQEEA